jgi:hypothetical protein
MKITILNGATATGKSAALSWLNGHLPGRVAVLDGDDVGRCALRENTMSPAWLNVFQANILACARNFLSLDLDHFVVAFVFPEQERIDRLNRIFRESDLRLNWIALILDDAHYRERISIQCQGNGPPPDIFEKSVLRNQQIAQLAIDNEFPCVDASSLTVEEMCRTIAETIETSNKILERDSKPRRFSNGGVQSGSR